MTKSSWSVDSWRNYKAQQQPTYHDQKKLGRAVGELCKFPPLVHWKEVDNLKALMARAGEGKAFILQGGDCAESFEYCNAEHIENKLKILLQMSVVLCWGARTPVVRIARMAGQYAKPRTFATEMVDGTEVLSYRGDHINGFDAQDREADPCRMIQAYFRAAATLNYVRALGSGGFSDIREQRNWDIHKMKNIETRKIYEEFSDRIFDAFDFISTIDADLLSKENPNLKTAEIFSSHEGLLLEYEEPLTRSYNSKHYNLGAHFLWIGDRTRQLEGAHVEYFRGIANPIGVKVGPTLGCLELVQLVKYLNPSNEPGRVSLITRYGNDKIESLLPSHIMAIQEAGLFVTWICDPMHGNTEKTSSGLKTRQFDRILKELKLCFSIHKKCGGMLNGVHFELTGENVTECMGGSSELTESDLSTNYTTFCDPRLNYDQSMDMAFLIANYYHKERSI